MLKNSLKLTLLSAAALTSMSCSSVINGEEAALSVAEEHPISVDSQVVTLTIDVDGSLETISDIDRARLRAFANAYLTEGHGPLTVTAPSGTTSDRAGQDSASDVRIALNDAGVPWASITGATYRSGDNVGNSQLIVSYTHYVASASKCGIWKGIRTRRYKNIRSPNFGCATQNNLAALVADPRDLIKPADGGGTRDAAVTILGIDRFRRGEDTGSEIGEIEIQTSN